MSNKKELNKNGNRRGMSLNSQKNIVSALRTLKENNHAKKDYSITRIVKEMLDESAEERWLDVGDKGKNLTWRQAIAKRILIEAVRGNARVTGDLLDRLEGKVTQPTEGVVNAKVVLEVRYVNRGRGTQDRDRIANPVFSSN
uniref:Uncharacterized protein n=1 Tax=viral metagenome TaxID=1070528 RepID=A0A6H1ZHJ3_9ZZZZ